MAKAWNVIVQVCLPAFTVLGFLLISLKEPQYGVIVSLVAQVFWIYSAYRAWREADQVGLLVNSILNTFIFAYGVINYWFL